MKNHFLCVCFSPSSFFLLHVLHANVSLLMVSESWGLSMDSTMDNHVPLGNGLHQTIPKWNAPFQRAPEA
jgi:hypothetical protein